MCVTQLQTLNQVLAEKCGKMEERLQRGDAERVRIEELARREKLEAEAKVAELVASLREEKERGEALRLRAEAQVESYPLPLNHTR